MLFFGLVIGLVFMYFILRPRLNAIKEVNHKTEEENQKLEQQQIQLNINIDRLTNEVLQKDCEIKQQLIELNRLQVEERELKKHIEKTRATIESDNEIIYQKSFELMQEKLSQAAEKEANKFQQAQDDLSKEYLLILEETAIETSNLLNIKNEELKATQKQLDDLRAKTSAAIAAAQREEEKLLELDKYKILISSSDLLEINRLREIAPYFKNSRAIYKIIWESYYRNSTNDLLNRILAPGNHTGIYKLTNLNNQKVYIGQAVNLSERLKDHIKYGLGIDTPNNILYTAMIKDGVENFTFEILEECSRQELNEKESYWINFYQSNIYGYNMTKGNK